MRRFLSIDWQLCFKQEEVFTDLDASLLHEETFSCAEIIDVLNTLLADGVLIIPNTSKTEVETRNVLESLNLKTPFIVENGAKLCITRWNNHKKHHVVFRSLWISKLLSGQVKRSGRTLH